MESGMRASGMIRMAGEMALGTVCMKTAVSMRDIGKMDASMVKAGS